MWLIFLDLLARVSFLFSLIGSAVILLYNLKIYYISYLSLVFVLFIGVLIKRRYKNLVFLPFLLLLFIPVSIYEKLFLLILGGLTLFLLYTQRDVTYGLVLEHFNKTYPIALLLFLVTFIMRYISTSKFIVLESVVSSSLLMYFVSSIILLRTLRYLEHKPEDKNLMSLNIRYALAVLIFSMFLSIPFVRERLFWGVSYIFSFIYFIFITIISVIFIIIGYVIGKIIYFIITLMANRGLIGRSSKEIMNINPELNKFLKFLWERRHITSDLLDKIIIVSFYILVTVTVILIIYWVMKRFYRTYKKEENYIEEKEFIFPSLNPIKVIQNLFGRSNLNPIRDYYRKYLLDSRDMGVDIRYSDTTYDVYKKTSGLFNDDSLKKMRNIYIEVRYGFGKITSELIKEFKKLYKSLNK
uniref:DUF4129 domain-containing protein n=1 Tax=Dictyoglomus turgidum TaxID=513050 RepID=A0A7C3WSG3_9BACT